MPPPLLLERSTLLSADSGIPLTHIIINPPVCHCVCSSMLASMCFVQMIKVATRQLVGWAGEGDQHPEKEEEGISAISRYNSLSAH